MSVSVEPYLTIGDRSVIASGRVITSNVAANSRVREKSAQTATD
jgi:acetyltransferase-like isoleucine patch superfamily enzyme